MKSIGERIKDLRESKKLTQKKLARMVGVSPSSVSQWEKGDTEPRGKNLHQLTKALDTTIEWLTVAIKKPVYELKEESVSCILVPFYPTVRASGGNGIEAYDEDNDLTPIPIKVLRNRNIDHIACITVTGDSMSPVIPDSSIIAFDKKESNHIRDGKVYVFKHRGLLRVKSLRKTPFELVIQSYNRDYEDEKYPLDSLEDFKILGKVFWISVEI